MYFLVNNDLVLFVILSLQINFFLVWNNPVTKIRIRKMVFDNKSINLGIPYIISLANLAYPTFREHPIETETILPLAILNGTLLLLKIYIILLFNLIFRK